ncbi:flagellar biosynthesis protein FlhF [Paenibacillus sp. BIHB 4019]|uniref:Flagellar biosynthesis protein FlhF n=1 Tax=Paenibacillus sp. BIHB 4019 TaxID=1870819 RepID=A0A1B2DPM9_9BACL|nr:flagellar biosynthesis protein FlhF [Paenibacillus sp. BIHB 4019]ANY69658.1 flagellar biosynthesis protein FlhF [Paenibacillus sp. BIHB 4019]
MRVKRYVVNALPEALPMIRSDLGKDAVILNTKEVKVGGFMGMFRKKKMEVIAAIESNAAAPENLPQKRKAPDDVSAVMAAITETMQKQQRAAAASAAATATVEPPARPAPVAAASPVNDQLMDEIKGIKQSLLQLSSQKAGNSLSEAAQALHDRLQEQELEAEWIDQLMAIISEQEGQQREPLTRTQVWELAKRQLLEWMAPYAAGMIDEQARIVHFVGPTGVGKTTTIAKLAANQTIKHNKKVGFITSDTYRIAAVDQLRTYANILNIPLEVVFSPMDLPKAFKQLEDRELIYMDTAGRNFRNELNVSEVNSLLQSHDRNETVLVLSLTGKTKDMTSVAGNFVKYGIEKVLFTKQDETAVYGSIFNLVMKFGLTPTYVARGQTVPDDIDRFNAAAYMNDLLGEADDE